MAVKRRALRLTAALLALALLSGCAFFAPAEPETAAPPAALWLWSGEPMGAALAALAEEYNETSPAQSLSVRVFDDENALAAALNIARPELLLCSGERAAALYAQEKLASLAPELALEESFLTLDESVGRAFFPLGAEMPVLAVNAAGYLASPVTSGVGEEALAGTESLCSLAAAHGRSTGQPFFAADSWAAFFALYLAQAGEDFGGSRESLAGSETGAALYNLLAETAFARGLYTGAEDAAELVRRGYVTSALLPSRALASGTEGLAIYPAPRLEGGEALLPVQLWGLAVTGESAETLPGAEAFLTWLFEPERAAALALDEGLLPGVAGRAVPGGEGTLEQALQRSAERSRFVLDRQDAAWRAVAADFDEELRAALALFD